MARDPEWRRRDWRGIRPDAAKCTGIDVDRPAAEMCQALRRGEIGVCIAVCLFAVGERDERAAQFEPGGFARYIGRIDHGNLFRGGVAGRHSDRDQLYAKSRNRA